jgi:glutamine synthetase
MKSEDIVNYVKEEKIDCVRLGFAPPNGSLKMLSIPTRKSVYNLEQAFAGEYKVDAAILDEMQFEHQQIEYTLSPDPESFYERTPIYQRDDRASFIMSNIYEKNSNTPSKICSRSTYYKTLQKYKLNMNVGTEIEFYLDNPNQKKKRGIFSDLFVNEQVYNENPNLPEAFIREEMVRNLIDAEITCFKSQKEAERGQGEIALGAESGLRAADNFLIATRRLIPDTATQHGYIAELNPKPYKNLEGNGVHIHLSIMQNDNALELSSQFGRGILNNSALLNFFLNRLNQSYDRLNCKEMIGFTTPTMNNSRKSSIRVPGSDRLEIRTPDNSMNIYLALTVLLNAGIGGMQGHQSKYKYFAKSLVEATSIMKNELEVNKQEILGVPVELIQILIYENKKRITSTGWRGLFTSIKQELNERIR